jgi:hypothetical protein
MLSVWDMFTGGCRTLVRGERSWNMQLPMRATKSLVKRRIRLVTAALRGWKPKEPAKETRRARRCRETRTVAPAAAVHRRRKAQVAAKVGAQRVGASVVHSRNLRASSRSYSGRLRVNSEMLSAAALYALRDSRSLAPVHLRRKCGALGRSQSLHEMWDKW